MMYYIKFGEILRKLRKEKGMSQSMLAELSGLSKAVISKYENSSSYPPYNVLICLAACVQVKYKFKLLKGTRMFKNLLTNKGFSLVECIIAIAIFAMMSLVLTGILLQYVSRRQKNRELLENLNTQVNIIIYNDADGELLDVFNDFQLVFYSEINPENEFIVLTAPYLNYVYNPLYKPVLDFSDYAEYLFQNHITD